MGVLSRGMRRYGALVVFGGACALAGAAGAGMVDPEKPTIVSFEDAKFVPIDPGRPDGARLAVLWGDPSKGPSAMLLVLKNGAGTLHAHSADYHLVLLQGTMKHWAAEESTARPLGPGSYWFQPGNQAHGDACQTPECLMFLKWEGKRDGWVASPQGGR